MLILGLYLDPPFIREALIFKRRNGIEVRSLQTSFLDEELPLAPPNVKPQYSTPTDETSFGGPKTNVKPLYIGGFRGKIVTGLSAKDSLIRSMEFKVANQKHREEIIAFQAEATSHFNPADILTVPLFSSKKEGGEALLFTVPRKAIQSHLDEWGKRAVDPDAVGSFPEALCQFVRWKIPSLTDAFIVNLGWTECTCAWMEKGQLKKAHALSGGIESLLANLLEDRKRVLLKKEIKAAAKQIDLLLLKSGLNPNLTGKLNELRQELVKVRQSFERGSEKKPLLFTGRTDAFIHLPEFLVEDQNLLQENKWSLTVEEQKFAIPIGLALSQCNATPLQFRREEFFPQKNWKTMGRNALFLLATSLMVSGAFLFLGLQSMQQRKQEMLSSLHASSAKRKLHLDEGSIEEKIDRWIAAVETNNKEYPYILQAPKVAEVLAWLSSHPLLEELQREGDPIEIREVSYQLVKLPKIGSTKEPYLAKVDLDFTFKSAMNARRLHEELRKGDDLIDSSQEIHWNPLSQGYRVSFFLKNRSRHVL